MEMNKETIDKLPKIIFLVNNIDVFHPTTNNNPFEIFRAKLIISDSMEALYQYQCNFKFNYVRINVADLLGENENPFDPKKYTKEGALHFLHKTLAKLTVKSRKNMIRHYAGGEFNNIELQDQIHRIIKESTGDDDVVCSEFMGKHKITVKSYPQEMRYTFVYDDEYTSYEDYQRLLKVLDKMT